MMKLHSWYLSLLVLLAIAVTVASSQPLPDFDRELSEFSTPGGHHFICWYQENEPIIHATLVLYKPAGNAAQIRAIARLWENAIPRSYALERAGAQLLLERDSLAALASLIDSTSTPHNTKIRIALRDREEWISSLLSGWFDIVKRLPRIREEAPEVVGDAVVLRASFPANSYDEYMSRIKDRLVDPVWMQVSHLDERMEAGWLNNVRQDERGLFAAPGTGSSGSVPQLRGDAIGAWNELLHDVRVSLAIVGKIETQDAMSAAELYFGGLQDVKSTVSVQSSRPTVQYEGDERIVTLPRLHRNYVVSWLLGGAAPTLADRLSAALPVVGEIRVPEIALSGSIPVARRAKAWRAQLLSDLDRAQNAADRLAVAALGSGWQSWFAVSQWFDEYDGTPEASWITALQMANQMQLKSGIGAAR